MGDVGPGDDVDDVEAPSPVGDDGGGDGRVGEQGVGDELLNVAGRWLDVQRGQLKAEDHRGLAARRRGIGHPRKARHSRVAAHVADVQALQTIAQPEVAREQDVEAGGAVARAGHHREQADVVAVKTRVVQAALHRAPRER